MPIVLKLRNLLLDPHNMSMGKYNWGHNVLIWHCPERLYSRGRYLAPRNRKSNSSLNKQTFLFPQITRNPGPGSSWCLCAQMPPESLVLCLFSVILIGLAVIFMLFTTWVLSGFCNSLNHVHSKQEEWRKGLAPGTPVFFLPGNQNSLSVPPSSL